MAKSKARPRHSFGEAQVEAKAISFEPSKIAKNVTDELKSISKQTGDEFWKQLLSVTSDAEKQVFGDAVHHAEAQAGRFEQIMSEGEELQITEENGKEKITASVEHNEYFREVLTGESRKENQTQDELRAMLEKIMAEIKAISSASDEMKQVAKETIKQQLPSKPGKYHLNFFSWLLDVVRNARVRVESGANWLKLFSSKKQAKSYHGMRKSHGTMFQLSSERSTATQTG